MCKPGPDVLSLLGELTASPISGDQCNIYHVFHILDQELNSISIS